MQRLEDGGGVYLGFCGGETVVRGNLVHGVHGGRMSVGIYMDAQTNRERIDGNVVWDCDVLDFDNAENGVNHNEWGKNVFRSGKAEPPEAQTLRDTTTAKRKKGLNPPEVGNDK
jgi:hypothetical protein